MRSMNLASTLFKSLIFFVILSSNSIFAEEQNDTFDIGKITCWDYTALEEADRVPAVTMIYGFVAAKHHKLVQSGASIKAAIEHASKLCDANPDMYVATAIERGLQ